MNSSKIRFAALIAIVFCFIHLGCQAVTVSTGLRERARASSEGIFGRMLDEVTEPERLEKERHKATMRKKQQLAEAEQQYQQLVQEDEKQAATEQRAAIEKQKAQQPLAKVLTATNEESQINMGELEANIQANLQAKLDAGASPADLLASVGQEETEKAAQQTAALTQNGPYQQRTQQAASSVSSNEVQVGSTSNSQVGSQETSKEKVRQIAKKLDIPFTNDLLALGSNAAISDALIEQAMAKGKTDAEINEAMETL